MRAQINSYRQAYGNEANQRDNKERQELIVKYAPLVKTIAERLAIRLPAHISTDELVSAGIVGLMDALNKFDASKKIKFQTYARHRIRGAMLDELRKMDWIPRSVRDDIQSVENAINALRMRLGREPGDAEIADEMGVDIETYFNKISKAGGINLLSLDDITKEGATPKLDSLKPDYRSPFDELRLKETKEVIAQALSALTPKEQKVVALYYYHELTLKEIAAILNLTESRISQIHAKAIIRLRSKLRAYHEA
jgi:RNA polymerase sigma factor FliA